MMSKDVIQFLRLHAELAENDGCAEEAKRLLDVVTEITELRSIVAELNEFRIGVTDLVEDAFCQIAWKINEGTRAGWWDTCALSTARDLGDRLVYLGTWERHPEGHGRRWFYRPIEATGSAKGNL